MALFRLSFSYTMRMSANTIIINQSCLLLNVWMQIIYFWTKETHFLIAMTRSQCVNRCRMLVYFSISPLYSFPGHLARTARVECGSDGNHNGNIICDTHTDWNQPDQHAPFIWAVPNAAICSICVLIDHNGARVAKTRQRRRTRAPAFRMKNLYMKLRMTSTSKLPNGRTYGKNFSTLGRAGALDAHRARLLRVPQTAKRDKYMRIHTLK